jgi:hypothetical protein
MAQEALLPQRLGRQVVHQIDAAFRLFRQLNEREARAGSGRVPVVDRAVEFTDRRSIDAGTAQPDERSLRIVHGERQDVDAGIAREEAIQRRTAGIRIDHSEQFDIGPVQHGAAVANTAISLAGKRGKREAEALILTGKRGEIARDDADMIERHGAHRAFS